jgi:peptide/nickel transport system ATP-binding protein
MPLLQVNNLHTYFKTRKGIVKAVNDVSFSLDEGKTLGIVGESGSGKSITAMSILRLLEENGYIAEGEILFQEGEERVDLATLPKEKMYAVRGNKISIIFQEPMTALNPVFTIERQLAEPFLIHQKLTKKEASIEALQMLEKVRIPSAERVLKSYAHQLSGGMRQRVMIAMALACRPKILIADEPTTALDVTIQAQILQLMKDLQKENGTAILFITHDLGVIKEMADDVAVMYCGQVVERVPAHAIFSSDGYSHPYTEGLLRALPSGKKAGKPLDTVPGNVPHPLNLPKGCKFSPRCRYCKEKCQREEPALFEWKKGHYVRCFYADEGERR